VPPACSKTTVSARLHELVSQAGLRVHRTAFDSSWCIMSRNPCASQVFRVIVI
jgi:hypothetical protein